MSEAQTVQDEDGFHEIQLNGKQLVFLGMTTTLVSVVIFLCGVLVGRGVKPIEPVAEAASAPTASAPAPETAAPIATPPPTEATPPAPAPAPAAAAATPPPAPAATPAAKPPAATSRPQATTAARTTTEPAPVDELSYYNALSKGGKATGSKSTAAAAAATKTPEPVAKSASKSASAPATPAAPAPAQMAASAPAAAPPVPVPADSAPVATPLRASTPPPAAKGGAIAVQVAALTSRSDAEAIARRLSSKGYAAYVLTPEPGAKQVFKVRVGNYASAEEAARVSRRLQQEEKLQPWVIR